MISENILGKYLRHDEVVCPCDPQTKESHAGQHRYDDKYRPDQQMDYASTTKNSNSVRKLMGGPTLPDDRKM
jgi:hypothetical protein